MVRATTTGSAPSADDELRRRWTQLTGREADANDIADDEIIDDIITRHAEPHRRYHTAAHVMWVLRHVDHLLDRISDGATVDASIVRAAAFFHDVIYDPLALTNERDSAELAAGALRRLGWAHDSVQLVGSLIEATAHHAAARAEPADDGYGIEHHILLDADLAILGAPEVAYRRYVDGVRAEYAHVTPVQWSEGRAVVLHSFLDRDKIFLTDPMYREREQQARLNLSGELRSLTSP